MQIKKAYKRLGFKSIEVVEITEKLNVALSTYQIFYHKLQNFHWNVEGPDFFDIHSITEDVYKESTENIDLLAERIRLFGVTPNYRLVDYIERSRIKESTHELTPAEMVDVLISDIEVLIQSLFEVYEFSTKHGDAGGVYTIQKTIHQLEMTHYKLNSWIK